MDIDEEEPEEIVYNDLSLDDILGWLDKKSNRHFSKGVDTLVRNREEVEKSVDITC